MALSPLVGGGGGGDIEDLTLCSYCSRPFDGGARRPKVLACKHHFCLECVRAALAKHGGRELYCAHCWKRTDVPDAHHADELLPTHAAVLALAQRLGQLPPAAPAPPPSSNGKPRQQQPQQPPPPAPPKPKLGGENCHAHAMPFTLWCPTCSAQVCRACAAHPDHAGHAVQPRADAKRSLRADVQRELLDAQRTLADAQRLVARQREFLLKILEACTTLKTQVETDLVNNAPSYELGEARDRLQKAQHAYGASEAPSAGPHEVRALLAALAADKERLRAKHHEMFLQCRLDDLIRDSRVAFDFDLLKRALAAIHSGEAPAPTTAGGDEGGHGNPILFLANYCMSQLYSRHFLFKRQQEQRQQQQQQQQQQQRAPFGLSQNGEADYGAIAPPRTPFDSPNGGAPPQAPPISPQTTLLRNPPTHVYPVFYFNVEINGAPFGRVLVEVRSDVAPRMAKNFGALATGELGVGYKGCHVFQCWENESIITGDFELNNGRGGRSIFLEESFFMPDDTKILAVRGSVGMRRSQKRHDNLGLVGSQFRIILREMRGFTGIFAFVVEGLELVDRISQSGDSAGKPQSSVVIASCGKFN